jgi:tRNA (cmo5U34)-methyltransferase
MSDKSSGAGTDARDRVFDSKMTSVADFKFDAKVASVFDDMVDRSVPFLR